ncbi:FAD-linked oxidase C-terminal domain-containing protein [Nocardia barduliensis]|uniref:FAD-linked oxidase C-terminal domain-containing protein n=1 Tax=Nocardia barduliensis TaxID=2736643 RepID=UPI001573098A|nr:FAD-linked oxidase C-terminal domain-containing protein [Nocardia barduliensis]
MNHTDTATLPAPDGTLLRELDAIGVPVGVRATDRLAAAHDGSHYLLVPQAVVTARNAGDVAATLRAARGAGVPVTFRSGGTSLSGQAGGSGVIVDTRTHFRAVRVLDNGDRVRTGPGATVRAVNAALLRHGRKLGPDPASEIACTIGGVVANNSSGMCCGTHANTYRTLSSAVLVLPSGTVIDTAAPDADELLRAAEPRIHAGLERLRDRVRADPDSVATIERLYAIKNTMGYGLNSFLDHDRPVDILEHLLVGSEGTLAFLAEATFRTVAAKAHAATGLLVFPTLAAATAALPALVDAGFAAIELLDATSLRVAQRDPEATAELRALDVDGHAALLVEHQGDDADELDRLTGRSAPLLDSLPLVAPATLTSDPATRAQLWHIRKGLFTAVAGARPSGTTALLEDIAVPVDRLLTACTRLIELFERHGYRDSVIFGHAKDGNIHFLLNERFDDPASLRRYEAFTEDMVELVLAQGGTLKAEHGTGRIMAPFLRRQYGDELYDVMREIKRLIDPEGLLNPGVLLTDDPAAHVRDLKIVYPVEAEVDRCVECGYCEPVCPSKDLTLTPRERIVLRREIARADAAGDTALVRQLRSEYEYDGVQTCAVDGMCRTACPVLIDTGDLVRRLRAENQSATAQFGWKQAAKHWGTVSRGAGIALSVAHAVPAALPGAATAAGRAVLGADVVPKYTAELPAGGTVRRVFAEPAAVAVYFSSCTTTMFGPAEPGTGGVAQSFLELCRRAGVPLATPADLPALCCGTPWKSKGLTEGYAVMRDRLRSSLLTATGDGELPVVCDASSCTEGLHVLLDGTGIRVLDAVEFVDRVVLDLLPPGQRVTSLTVHPTCSATRMGIGDSLRRVAAAAAEDVHVPENWGCCGFAGDRGMLHPELTAAATAPEAAATLRADAAAHASLNRTCELGMTRATGLPYRHVLEILADALPSMPPSRDEQPTIRHIRPPSRSTKERRLNTLRIEDRVIPGTHNPIPIREYHPAGGASTAPPLLWLHGGAFVYGGLDMRESDLPARLAATERRVVTVRYRLAPARGLLGRGVPPPHPNRFPAALDDVVDVARWLAADSGSPIHIGGASGGANLSAAAAVRLRDEAEPAIASTVLFYGLFHGTLPPAPEVEAELDFFSRPLLTPAMVRRISINYTADETLIGPGPAFPGGTDLHGFPPTLMIDAHRDWLRASGAAMHRDLREAGVEVEYTVIPGTYHGFLGSLSQRASRQSMALVGTWLKKHD